MKSLSKANLPQFLEALNQSSQVYVPVVVDGTSRFIPWEQGAELVLDKNSNIPPKYLFFPQTEDLYGYKIYKQSGERTELPSAMEPFVVFGIRPCDVYSLEVLDDIFLTKGYEDVHYKQKREQGLLISLGCLEPEATCFCESWGLNPLNAPTADIMMLDGGDQFLLKAQTEAGQKVIDSQAGLLEEFQGEPPVGKPCTLTVETKGLMERLQPMFEHAVWDEISRKCINCGTCTYLCPTCYCFDVLNKTRGEEGIKYRCYDSCMYPEYTLMAGGHNPRPTKKERVRQRFLHKFQYIPERYEGQIGCVGCGRCIVKCPVNLDISRVITRLWEVEADV
ncbi:MAG: 4Fe-4S dicluster domain-containing protein [Bacillota bacterium]